MGSAVNGFHAEVNGPHERSRVDKVCLCVHACKMGTPGAGIGWGGRSAVFLLQNTEFGARPGLRVQQYQQASYVIP
jgi:hypothetical protein